MSRVENMDVRARDILSVAFQLSKIERFVVPAQITSKPGWFRRNQSCQIG